MKYYVLMALFLSFLSMAQDNVIDHLDCRVKLFKDQQKKYSELFPTLIKILKSRGYAPYSYIPGVEIKTGDLYLDFSKNLLGTNFYPACQVKITISKTNNSHMSKVDKKIHDVTSKRLHPRHTFEGVERCKLAIRDALNFLKQCKKLVLKKRP